MDSVQSLLYSSCLRLLQNAHAVCMNVNTYNDEVSGRVEQC